MNALAERLEKVLADLGWSRRQWALKAGLSHSAITQFLIRAAKSDTASLKSKEIEALASVAGVPFEWLATGDGSGPAPATVSRTNVDVAYAIAEHPVHELREPLKRFYKTHQDDDAVATVKHYLFGLDRKADRTVTDKEWEGLIQGYYKRLRKGSTPWGK